MKKLIFLTVFSFFLTGSMWAQYSSYRIKKGDNISKLTEKFNIPKSALFRLNPDLKEGVKAGTLIILPPQEIKNNDSTVRGVEFKEYNAKPKETLYSLAKRYHTSVKEIKKYNPELREHGLQAGEMIRIPIHEGDVEATNRATRNSTFKNIIHVVAPKETKYGISKKYDITIEQLEKWNPGMETIQPGQILKIENPKAIEHRNGFFDLYEVKPKETLYSLTRRFDISKDSLETLNPEVRELGLQKGMRLRIPKGKIPEDELDEEDTGFSSKFVNLSEHLKNYSTKRMAVLLPFNLQKLDRDSVDRKEVLGADPYMQISLDLYQGIKEAIDSAATLGIKVEADVIDTQKSPYKISQIIRDRDLKDKDLIIGPLLSQNVERVATSLRGENPVVISPLVNANLSGSDRILQTRPSNSMKNNVLLDYLKKQYEDQNILVLNDNEHRNFANNILNQFPSARRVTQAKEDYLQRGDLTKLLSSNRPNWVIIETGDYGTISNAVSYLNAMRNKYDIRLFTSDKNKIYDEEVDGQFLSHLQFTYASLNRSDIRQNSSFFRTYRAKYGIAPGSMVVRGFDVAFDAILRSAVDTDIISALKDFKGISEYTENRFEYHKKPKNGYENTAVYLIKFDEDLELKVLN